MVRAMFPGTFDPIHYGHIDIALRAARLFDEVLMAVYDRPLKSLMFEPEERMALANQRLADDIETVALITAEEHTFLSSSTVKEIATLGGDVSSMVPPFVEKALRSKVTTLGDQHSPPNSLRD